MNVLMLMGFSGVALAAIAVPWVGVLSAYLIAILNPQSIWWWNFDGFRPALFVTAPVIVGFLIEAMRGRLTTDAVRNVQSVAIVVVLASCTFSAFVAPYATWAPELGVRNSGYILEVFSKIVLLYFIACLCASREVPVRSMAWMVVGCSAYLVYWANNRYFELGWVFRLEGPMDLTGSGIYADENNFATFFVMTLPFVWFMSLTLSNRWVRYALWAIVPLGWHAVFLTASRGGLLGLVAVLLFVMLRRGHRGYGVLLLAAFALAFHYQAGDTMKERAAGIDDYQEDSSASGRLDAWEAATAMIRAQPLTGVGPGSFLTAFADFSGRSPLQAHNTYFQIGAEYGPIAAIALLTAILASMLSVARAKKRLVACAPSEEARCLIAILDATLAAIVGMLVCTMFLSLQIFELLYFMIFMSSAGSTCARRLIQAENEGTEKADVLIANPIPPRNVFESASKVGRA